MCALFSGILHLGLSLISPVLSIILFFYEGKFPLAQRCALVSSDFSLHLLILHPLIATLTASGPDSKELYLHAVSNHSGPMNPLSSYESTSFLSILCETQRSLIHLHLVQPFGKKDTVNRSLLEKCCLCGFQDAIFCLPSSPLLTRVSLHWLLLYPDLRC